MYIKSLAIVLSLEIRDINYIIETLLLHLLNQNQSQLSVKILIYHFILYLLKYNVNYFRFFYQIILMLKGLLSSKAFIHIESVRPSVTVSYFHSLIQTCINSIIVTGKSVCPFTNQVVLNFLEKKFMILLSYSSIPATVAQHVAHPLVVGKVIGSNLGPTPRHN